MSAEEDAARTQQNLRATMCVQARLSANESIKGSAFVIRRLASHAQSPTVSDIIVSMSAHVAKSGADVTLLDYKNRRYNPQQHLRLLEDVSLDIVLVLVRDVPQDIPSIVGFPTNRTVLPEVRTSCYTIGWPLAVDTNSVSAGIVRNPCFSRFTLPSIAVDVACTNGNSGGGVFDAASHLLIGMVWYVRTQSLPGSGTGTGNATLSLTNNTFLLPTQTQVQVTVNAIWDSFAGLVPGGYIAEALETLGTYPSRLLGFNNYTNLNSFNPTEPVHTCISRNDYLFGVQAAPIGFDLSISRIADVVMDIPWLGDKANVGLAVLGLTADGPAEQAYIMPGEIMWAVRLADPPGTPPSVQAEVRRTETAWIMLSEDTPLQTAIYELARRARVRRFQQVVNSRSTAAMRRRLPPQMQEGDPWLPEQLPVRVLTLYDGIAYDTLLMLPRRWAYLQSYGDVSDSSAWTYGPLAGLTGRTGLTGLITTTVPEIGLAQPDETQPGKDAFRIV